MSLDHSFKEFCYQRGAEKQLLATGHVGSNVGFIFYGEYRSLVDAERMLGNWGVDNMEDGTYFIEGNRSWTPVYANVLMRESKAWSEDRCSFSFTRSNSNQLLRRQMQ